MFCLNFRCHFNKKKKKNRLILKLNFVIKNTYKLELNYNPNRHIHNCILKQQW